jgi:hypothetical protein
MINSILHIASTDDCLLLHSDTNSKQKLCTINHIVTFTTYKVLGNDN